ncbi:MBL fold metallo-hydrolase [Paenibacillus alkalitolerans]|uniref:MBL fold metallo-hydrolase n=1 Tax=Paenibacillus alkalitolerans TaxID=2799335 RepID=UPI0018F3858C|nr:MBL fold metallo-hydrolase [Paenibacillus alkalitolerans]
MKTVTEVSGGLFQIKVPLPFPLQWVNAYAIRGKDGWTVVDPGLHTPQAEQRWEQSAQAVGMDWDAVQFVVLTHHHPDHYGMAGWFQNRTGAAVYASADACSQAQRLWGDGAGETADQTLEMFIRHGLPEDKVMPMREHLSGFIDMVSPQPANMAHIDPGSAIRLGDDEYEAVLTEGHASGHLSFLNRDTRRIFCGDHVLPGITPNVSLLPYGDQNPLRTYLQALEAAESLPVSVALPGHREPFNHFAQRCAAIRKHHDERLERIAEMRKRHADAYSLCAAMFGSRLSVHQLRFALSETIAHIVYLES